MKLEPRSSAADPPSASAVALFARAASRAACSELPTLLFAQSASTMPSSSQQQRLLAHVSLKLHVPESASLS